MTCIPFNGCIVCVNPWGRLHVGKRYYWVDFHEWLGPTFFMDANMETHYEPTGEDDPIWNEFEKWLVKFQKAKEREARRKS